MAQRSLQILIRAPVEHLASILGEPTVYATALPMVTECVYLEPPEERRIRLRVLVVREFELILRIRTLPGGRIEWSRVEGDLQRVEGSWDLQAGQEEGTTEARLELTVEAGFPLPPEVVDSLLETSLPAALARLTEHLELRCRGGGEALPPP